MTDKHIGCSHPSILLVSSRGLFSGFSISVKSGMSRRNKERNFSSLFPKARRAESSCQTETVTQCACKNSLFNNSSPRLCLTASRVFLFQASRSTETVLKVLLTMDTHPAHLLFLALCLGGVVAETSSSLCCIAGKFFLP